MFFFLQIEGFLATPYSLWDPTTQTRDWTQAMLWKHQVLNIELLGFDKELGFYSHAIKNLDKF